MRRVLFLAVISCLFSVSAFCAPYLGKEFEFHQPDGSPIAVRVWGDEFYIRAETLDGYSLVRDPVSGFICYAEVNSDGSDFISTGIPYTGQTVEELKYSGLWPLAQGNGIKKGLRLKHQAVIEKADRNRRLLGRDQLGRILPAPDSDASSAASAQADSPAPLIGEVIGLTLLIQFPDVPATISQADIDNYCNQVGYTGYGNNGSVRDYFYDVSNGNLTYTNYVTVYYTAQYNRSYYTDPNISYGQRARELIQEALLWLDNPSGQNFNFGIISTDASNYMLAINAFYAGPTTNEWAEGLWPHMSSMYGMFTSNEGVKAGVYQITDIGSSLVLGTFCHENGHMICDYPDLYDYGYESYGAGNYCLMAYGGSDYNPIPPNPYLRDIKGWESVTVFPHLSGVQYFIQSNSNTSYKYLNPNNSEEFFYIDSRTKTGRNSSLPDDGLVIWHIDENGSNDNEQMTPSLHYLVSVEQADGLFHLEYGSNPGGSGDLFHAGYKDIFNDTTNPNAKWWNGNNSNLVIRQISIVGSTMSFVYDDGTVPHPPVAIDVNTSTPLNTPATVTLSATDEGLPNPPGVLSYIITSLPSNGSLSDPGAGGITAVPYTLIGGGNQVIYTPTTGYSGTDSFQFKANDSGTPPEGGDSNIAAVSISVIDAIYIANMDTNPGWTLDSLWQWGTPTGSGGQYGNHDPTAGYTGAKVVGYNLLGDYENSITSTRWAKTPAINCTNRTGVTLTFYRWLNVEQPAYDHAYIQVSNNGSSWSTIWENPLEITDSSWTLQTFDISAIADNQPTVYIRWGMGTTDPSWQYSGWNIDDVKVTGVVVAPPLRTLTISSTLGGHTEPNAGTHQYNDGIVVDINAVPDPNYHFVNWTGTAVTAGKVANPNLPATTVLMDANYTVQANFAIVQRTLTISSTAGGSVTQPGIGAFQYGHGTVVDLNAVPSIGYHFVNWTGDTNTVADSNAAVTTITMDANYAIQANFSINQYPVTATSGPNGSIDPQGTIIVNYGDNLCFTAAPNTCYEVNEWYLDGNLAQTGGLIYTLNNIQADAIVLVNFKPTVVLTMSVSPSEAGITVPAIGTNEVAKNEAISISAQSNAGYSFVSWSAAPAENVVFGNPDNPSTTATLSNNATITAIFLPPVDLTMAAQPPEGGTTTPPVGTSSVEHGLATPIEAHANAGYVFNGWTASPAENVIFGNPNSPSTTVTLSDNATVTAIFLPPVDLTMAVQPPEGGTTTPPVGTSSVEHGLAKPIEAHANAGYVFNGWTASPAENVIFGNPNSPSTTVTLSDNATVTAIFLPPVDLTMAAQPPEGGTTTPSVGTSSVEHGLATPIEAHANAGYSLMSWTAIPAENVVFGNANAPSTTATLSGNATVTANFNSQPVADINATVNVLVITDGNSVTLDATGSTDDGLPNPPGIMTYHWEKVSGPNTCNILDPNIAVTGVLFWGLGSYEFSVTVSDGQLQDVESATVDVVVDVAYVASDGDDNTGLGTIENPFATIQRGMDVVRDDGTVIVLTGIYYENIDFGGRKIMVKSVNPDDPSIVANTVIDASGSGSAVTFNSGEDANSVLAGFTITGGNTTLGGGIYIDGASPIIEKNVITGNSASSEGGGIYCQGGSATIRYNKISNNYSSLVGGVSFESSFAVLQNNLIVDNSADYDSGIACVDGQPRIVNNTIAGNVAVYDYDSSGLIIASSSLPPIISNNIIAFNDGAPGVVDFGGFDPNYFSYNDVYGHPNGNYFSWCLPTPDQTGVNGNISVNPLFADTAANNYHLLPESLLIDAGNPSSDWSNEPRPNGGRINMGAYGNTSEASCSVAGDITWDKKVDFKDFAKLAFYWLQNEPSVDIAPLLSGDSIVDVEDLAVLAEHWLEGSAP